jgi:two-component system sensor histidine kinase BaeS
VSFRLRIFLLVIVVALTAIGATAWLTLSLTSREVKRAQQASDRHQARIHDTIERYGVTHGDWGGVDVVVKELSAKTGLHIQVATVGGARLADSDNLAGRAAGPVQSVPTQVDARPKLRRLPGPSKESGAPMPTSDPNGTRAPPSYALDKILAATGKRLQAGVPIVPRDLFGAEPTDPFHGSSVSLMLRQLSQYRAGLLAVRCIARTTPGVPAALATDTAPYLSKAQLTKYRGCVRQSTDKVLGDTAWMKDVWATFFQCIEAGTYVLRAGCLTDAFLEAAATTSPAPAEVFIGAPTGADISVLGQPAAVGVAGLVLVALIGTAWIARRVSRPVRRLTEASRELAGGRLDVRVPAAGKGELARLSASFNTMAEAVQRSEERQRRLVADVAHEMRTPLSNLRGYLEGLSDGVVQPSRELFVSLHEETMLQRRILDDLQVLALAEAGDLGYTRAPIDLADLVGVGATLHRAVAAEAGIALTVDVPAPVWVDADPDRLRQVLGNLLTNAIRYTDAGGHVLVRVRAETHEAVLTVQDTGVGMTQADLSRVFDRFWRADPARQRATGGTGLGLTIAQRIVTDHGGRIEVTSEPGRGTTFTTHLPLLPVAAVVVSRRTTTVRTEG